MRVAYWGPWFGKNARGGGEISNLQFCKALQSRGHEVVAFAGDWKPKKEVIEDYVWEGVQVIQRDVDPAATQYKWFLKEWKPDLVFGMTEFFYRYLWRKPTPYIFVCRGYCQIFRNWEKGELYSPGMKEMMNKAEVVLANSSWIAGLLEAYTDNVEVVYPPVLSGDYRVFKTPAMDSVVALAGTKQKGGRFIAKLAKMLPGVNFIVAGKADGSLKGLPNVELRGHISDVRDVLARARIGIHLHDWPEPFGRALLEFMSNAIPVISWQSYGPAEILGGNRTSVLPGKLDIVADMIMELFRDQEAYDRECQAAVFRWDHFRGQKQLDRFVELVEKVDS